MKDGAGNNTPIISEERLASLPWLTVQIPVLEAEAGGDRVEGNPGLYINFKASLDNIERPFQ